jgi:hypothetical protein
MQSSSCQSVARICYFLQTPESINITTLQAFAQCFDAQVQEYFQKKRCYNQRCELLTRFGYLQLAVRRKEVEKEAAERQRQEEKEKRKARLDAGFAEVRCIWWSFDDGLHTALG